MKVFINDDAFLKKGFSISTDKSLLDFEAIYNYLDKESYWAKGIPVEKLKIAIGNSLCFGIYHHQTQAGFARVVTDKATFAYICDVFILPEFRNKSLSKWLIQTITGHPELQGLRRWSLATADAHGLYSQFGFTEITRPDRWMEIFTPYQVPNEEEDEHKKANF
ncbi:GNAT family N-acetyltransferase [Mucilaginibacter sp.]|uniref:GNAT family N-acetyltransferase n=1 Tax=Mucilaginibacter sp. TaxID=1882438 RepID=UPI002638E790|nr:GNAT family N-acetyltransferase [Mucilaginibacter sp.]MDB5032471.1 acetyltransferase family protein [Mucilaginibacter sp.]